MAQPDPRLEKLFIGYVRNSTEMQRDNFSIEAQRKWCEKTAIERGYTSIDIREEQATSGQTIDARFVFKECLDDIRAGKVGAFAAISVDRITRDDDLLDGLVFFQACKDNDVLIITKDIDFDPRNPVALDMLTFQLMGSRHQNVANLTGLMRGLMQAAEEGKLLNGVLPFGYDRTVSMSAAQTERRRRLRSWLEVNEDEAKVVRMIHDWVQLMGTQLVADKLNRLDYRFPVKSLGTQRNLGKTERLWRGTDVLRIVRNPLYMGVKRWGGARLDSKYLRDMKGPFQVPIPSLRIVDAAIWQSNNSLLDKRNPALTAPRSANSPYVFSGQLRCAICRGPMKGSRKRTRGKRYRIYECSNRAETGACSAGSISERVVVQTVRRHLGRVLANIGLERVLDDALDIRMNETDHDIVGLLDQKIAELQGQQTKLLRLHLSGAVTDSEFKREKVRLHDEESRIKLQRSREALRNVERVSVEELRSYMGTDLVAWVPKMHGRRLSRLSKLVFGHFEVQSVGVGNQRVGKLKSIVYTDDYARLTALMRAKRAKNGELTVPTRRLSPRSNH